MGPVLPATFDYSSKLWLQNLILSGTLLWLTCLFFLLSLYVYASPRRKDVGMWFLVAAPLAQALLTNLLGRVLDRVLEMPRRKRFLLWLSEREPPQSCVRRWGLASKIALIKFFGGLWIKSLLYLFILVVWVAFFVLFHKQKLLDVCDSCKGIPCQDGPGIEGSLNQFPCYYCHRWFGNCIKV